MSVNSASKPSRSTQPISQKLSNYLEVIRQEYEALGAEMDLYRSQKFDYESKVNAQIAELSTIRRSLYDLDGHQNKIRLEYEKEINRLRAEIMALRRQAQPELGLGIQGLPSVPSPSNAVSSPSTLHTLHATRDPPRPRVSNEQEKESSGSKDSERELDRPVDHRDPKRVKVRRETAGHRDPSAITSYTSVLLPSQTLYSSPASGNMPMPKSVTGNGPLPPMNLVPKSLVNELKFHVPAEFKKEFVDWSVIFNPDIPRAFDVNLVHTFVHESVVCCVQFSPDGRYLATGCNHSTQIYDIKTGAKICVLIEDTNGQSEDLYIRSVRFSPDGALLATGAEDRQIRIWDIARRRVINKFAGHEEEIYSLDFSTDGRLVASGSGDRTTRIWDRIDNSCKTFTITLDDSPSDAGVTSVAISPNSTLVAAGSLDTLIRIWDIATGTVLEQLRGHKDSVYSVAFTQDGKGLLSGSLDKTLKFWDISQLVDYHWARRIGTSGPGANTSREPPAPSVCTKDFVGHLDYVLSVCMSRDGRWAASGSKDRCVRFWDARDASLQFILQGHKNSVISLEFNPQGNMIATGGGDHLTRIWSFNRI